MENRLPCSDTNPHLIAAATIAAGLAGMEQELEPSPSTSGNGYAPGAAYGPALARDIGSAIAALRESAFARTWLGDGFVDGFAATRSAQVEQFDGKSLIDERRRFFELG